MKELLVAGVLGMASIGAAWWLTGTPAAAASVQNSHLVGVVPRDQIEADVRKFKWPRVDRLETKLGGMDSSSLCIRQMWSSRLHPCTHAAVTPSSTRSSLPDDDGHAAHDKANDERERGPRARRVDCLVGPPRRETINALAVAR